MDMMSNQCMEDEKLNKWSLKDQEKYMNAAEMPEWTSDSFYSSLKPNRNFYFLSRRRPLEYHVGAVVQTSSGKKNYHFSGAQMETLRLCSTMIKGPCCDWKHYSNKSSCLFPSENNNDEETEQLLDMARKKLQSLHGEEASIEVTYEGRYQAVTITEFIVQDSSRNGFVAGMRTELESQLHGVKARKRGKAKGVAKASHDNNNAASETSSNMDMEMMDLQCMLSCLPETEEDKGNNGTPEMGNEPKSQAVCMASVSLLFDEHGVVLNEECWKTDKMQTSLSRLSDLSPRKEAIWLDYTPTQQGFLQLLQFETASDMTPLLRSCAASLQALRRNTYESPLPLLTYLENEKRFPSNYRQWKSLSLNYFLMENGQFQQKHSCRVRFNVYDAVRHSPQSQSITIMDGALQLNLDLTLAESSTLRLTIYRTENHECISDTTCSFQSTFTDLYTECIHISSMALFEGDLTVTLPWEQYDMDAPEEKTQLLRLYNGSFHIC